MQIKRIMAYKEGYLPSPRHRKQRFRQAEAVFTAEIQEAAAAEAPANIVAERFVGKECPR